MTDPQNRFRSGLLNLAGSYMRLVALSFGFQHAFGKNNTDENPFLLRVSDLLDPLQPSLTLCSSAWPRRRMSSLPLWMMLVDLIKVRALLHSNPCECFLIHFQQESISATAQQRRASL